ncbi:MAG: Transketolase central region [Clostridia bacterium]|nr:Transketolase central region [Clostridia bacterium]
MAGLTYTMIDTANLSTSELYGKVLCDLGEKHPEIVGLSADLAKSTKIGLFGDKFPERFFNVGIAEQNMFGMAAGMAKAGLVPFASTFAIFTSMLETANAVQAAYETPGPVYIRINRGFDQKLYESTEYGFEIGKAVQMADGTDLTIIACGSCVFQALEAAKILDSVDGIKARVLNIHTIKPIDREAILKAVHETRRIITVEDHNVIGGLGSAVAEVMAESGKACAFKRLGIPDVFSIIGLHEDLMAFYKIDTNGILENVRELMGRDFEADENWDDEV